MAWRIEVTHDAVEDQRRIFRHLFEIHRREFGHGPSEAADKAERRSRAIDAGIVRIAKAVHIGTRHVIQGHEFRHLTIDRAIYWFTLDEAARCVRIEAIFFGGQDHVARMLDRLSARTEGGG